MLANTNFTKYKNNLSKLVSKSKDIDILKELKQLKSSIQQQDKKHNQELQILKEQIQRIQESLQEQQQELKEWKQKYDQKDQELLQVKDQLKYITKSVSTTTSKKFSSVSRILCRRTPRNPSKKWIL